MISDPLGDMLVRIKNASLARHKSLVVPHSSLKENLAKLLAKEGFLEKVSILGKGPKKSLQINLEYKGRQGVLGGVKRISKPGLRIYVGAKEIPLTKRGKSGLVVLSTSKGLMSGEQAKKKKLGGELLCEVW